MIFAPILQLTTGFISDFVLFLNLALKISAISIIHDNAQFSFFCFVDLTESNNIGVLKNFQDLCFSQCFSSFFFWHGLDVNLFNDSQGFIWLAFNKIRRSKWSNTKSWHFFVCFVLLFFHFSSIMSFFILN